MMSIIIVFCSTLDGDSCGSVVDEKMIVTNGQQISLVMGAWEQEHGNISTVQFSALKVVIC